MALHPVLHVGQSQRFNYDASSLMRHLNPPERAERIVKKKIYIYRMTGDEPERLRDMILHL